MTKNTFNQQAKIVSHMLHRKFEGCSFVVSVHKEFTKKRGYREISRRWISVVCDFGPQAVHQIKDVVYYLQRFQDGEEDRRGHTHTRSFWVSESGFATLALIRRYRGDGTSSIVERHKPLNKNQTKLVRFEIQEYDVSEKAAKKNSTFNEENWGEFTE